MRQLPPDQAPRVALDVWRDSESGWNLHVTTERFRFAPEHVGDTAWAIDGGMVRDGASITGTGGEHDTGHQHGHG